MKEQLKNQFIHNEDNITLKLQKKNVMNFDVIKEIDQEDYSQKYKHMQFGDIFNKNKHFSELITLYECILQLIDRIN